MIASRQREGLELGWIDVGRGSKRKYRGLHDVECTLLTFYHKTYNEWDSSQSSLVSASCLLTRNFPREDYCKLRFASEVYHLLGVGDEMRLKPSDWLNQTDYHLLSRRQLPSAWLANKNLHDVAVACSIQVQVHGRANFKTCTRDTQIDVHPHSSSEIQRRATIDISRTAIILLSTYWRFFAAQSLYIFLNLQSNTVKYFTTTTFRHLGLRQACWKRTATIGKTVNSLRKRQTKYSTRPLLAQKCKYSDTITVWARADVTNHMLRRYPWHVHGLLPRFPRLHFHGKKTVVLMLRSLKWQVPGKLKVIWQTRAEV